MELPDDVLQLVRDYSKPSEPYKLYTRVLKILLNFNEYITLILRFKIHRIVRNLFRMSSECLQND